MTQVTAINTRQVKKIDGQTIFNIVQKMTGEPAAEIVRVIPPKMVPMIGKNDPQQKRYYYNNNNQQTLRSSWDSDQQVSWGNALKQLKEWKDKAGDYNGLLGLKGTAHKKTPTLPKIFTDWVKNNIPAPWTQREKETAAHEIMVNLIASKAGYNQRTRERARLKGLPYNKLEKELYDISKNPFDNYNLPWGWRGLNTVRERKQKLADDVATREATAIEQNLIKAWKTSPEAMSKEMLMYVGGNSPQYMMSWIIANTYQQANPLVKNIASKEGSHQWKVWRLNERYYPAMSSTDTLPKTTMKWPRYSSDPKILQIFNLPEIMKSLKSTFSSKQDVMANQQQLAFDEWKDRAEQNRAKLFQGNWAFPLNKIIDNGIDYYNEHSMSNSYTYYPDYNNRDYSTRKTVQVDPKDQILVSWAFIEKEIGAKELKKFIGQREAGATIKYNDVMTQNQNWYDKRMATIKAARTALKNKGKAPKK